MSCEVAIVEQKVARLPDRWLASTVGEIADILDSKRVPLNSDERRARPGPYPYWGANGIVDYIDDYIFDEPLVLMAEDGGYFDQAATRPICHRLDGRAWVNNHAHIIRPTGADRDYCYYWFVHRDITPFIKGGTRSKLNQAELKRLPIWLPPLDEQRRIAEVLRSVDEAIAAADAVIGQLRETRGHRLEALMALPGEFRRIDEICRLSGGNGFPIRHQGKTSGRYPFAKVSDMNRSGNEVQMRHAKNYVDEADLRTLKGKTFPVGTTFFPKVGATLLTNKRRIAAVEMLVDNNVMGAVATDVVPWFLYYAFCTVDMADYVQPGAVPSVNQRTIGQILVPVPDRAVQEEFVETMRDLDTAIDAQSDALSQLIAAKLAVMSDLLSGRVRVPA